MNCFRDFLRLKRPLKIDVSTTFTGLLQVVKNYQLNGLVQDGRK